MSTGVLPTGISVLDPQELDLQSGSVMSYHVGVGNWTSGRAASACNGWAIHIANPKQGILRQNVYREMKHSILQAS